MPTVLEMELLYLLWVQCWNFDINNWYFFCKKYFLFEDICCCFKFASARDVLWECFQELKPINGTLYDNGMIDNERVLCLVENYGKIWIWLQFIHVKTASVLFNKFKDKCWLVGFSKKANKLGCQFLVISGQSQSALFTMMLKMH